jgi:hypothetical protein
MDGWMDGWMDRWMDEPNSAMPPPLQFVPNTFPDYGSVDEILYQD